MALIGLVRATNDAAETTAQHDALDPICTHVFKENASQRRVVENRPQLVTALRTVRPGDLLVVMKIRHLARTSLEGLEVLADLVDRGVAVKVLAGMAEGDHIEDSHFLTECRQIAADHRRTRSDKIKAGLAAARERGAGPGRPRKVDDAMRADIVARRARGDSLRSIADAVGVSVGTVHNIIALASHSPDGDRSTSE
ncbi:recombinase family protein [Luteimicrobium sp. NPDC057192]|uniref:recombinase family protein n=1 Tax=Luteimicrobium sp. NPDC057192 TaxID=3346042 RepID=UPI0036421507